MMVLDVFGVASSVVWAFLAVFMLLFDVSLLDGCAGGFFGVHSSTWS